MIDLARYLLIIIKTIRISEYGVSCLMYQKNSFNSKVHKNFYSDCLQTKIKGNQINHIQLIQTICISVDFKQILDKPLQIIFDLIFSTEFKNPRLKN